MGGLRQDGSQEIVMGPWSVGENMQTAIGGIGVKHGFHFLIRYYICISLNKIVDNDYICIKKKKEAY